MRIVRELGFREVSVIYPREIPKVKTVNKYDFFSIIKEIVSSNAVFFGGGGILQDETSLKSFLYYSFIAVTASLFGKRVVFLGNGFGPIRKRFSKMLMRFLMGSRRVVFFPRDPVSSVYLSKRSKNVRIGSDLAIGYLRRVRPESKRKDAVVVPKNGLPWKELTTFLKKLGYEPKILVADPSDVRVVDAGSYILGLPVEELARASIVVSERFHPALVAAYFGVPFVAIGRKSSRFFRKYLPGYPGLLENPSEIDVMVAIQKVLKTEYDIRERLEKDYDSMISSLKAVKF